MDNNKIYINDIGTIIKLNAGSDISTATVLKFKVIKPDKTTDIWDAELDEENNYLANYTTVDDDLDQKGEYKIQLYVEMPEWKGHGETNTFRVYELFT